MSKNIQSYSQIDSSTYPHLNVSFVTTIFKKHQTKGEKEKAVRQKQEGVCLVSESKRIIKYVQKQILPDVTNLEEKCRQPLGANQIKSLSKNTNKNGFVLSEPYWFTSTVAQKNPDKIPGCQICNRNSYQNGHHPGAVAEQWVESPSSDYWSGDAWNLAGCTRQLCAFLLHFHRGHRAHHVPLLALSAARLLSRRVRRRRRGPVPARRAGRSWPFLWVRPPRRVLWPGSRRPGTPGCRPALGPETGSLRSRSRGRRSRRGSCGSRSRSSRSSRRNRSSQGGTSSRPGCHRGPVP